MGSTSNYDNLEFWELDDLPVFNEAPFYQDVVIYRDEHHLNEVGALAYAKNAASFFSTSLESNK
jgi:hypothetical protein